MRSFILTLTLLSISIYSGAQSSISGTVSTPEGDAAEYATVMVMTVADSSLVKAGYAEADGSFRIFPLEAGDYFVKVTYIGFEEAGTPVLHIGTEADALDIGKIVLNPSSAQLEEVVVKGKKPLVQVKPDKTVFNVEGSINAAGNDGLELLRKSPGVVVDHNENITLQGKSGVQVYINDKPSYLSGADLAQFLKSMQSSDIEAVEIITNPSSKYDAEGNAGIINIVLKRNENFGTNATLNGGYAIGKYAKYNGSVIVNNRTEKTSSFVQVGMNTGLWYNFQNFYREQNGWQLEQGNTSINDNRSQNFRVGMDVYLGKQSTIGFMSNGYFTKGTHTSSIQTRIATLESGTTSQFLLASNDTDGSRENMNFNLNYRWKGQKGTSLNIDLDYGFFQNDATMVQPNTYFEPDQTTVIEEKNYYTLMPTSIDIYTAKIDYETPFLKGVLGIGVKSSYVQTDNTFDFFNMFGQELERDMDRSNSFSYLENVNAAYLNYQVKLDKWALQIGLRGEHTHSDGQLTAFKPGANDRTTRNYFNLFPSGGLTWEASQKHAFRLSYSKRLDRPKYQNLNPFEFKLDELTYERGNAFLNPQYTDQVQFAHTFNQRLNTTLSYSKTIDLMAQITDKDPSNELAGFITQMNVAEQEVVSLTVSYPFSLAKWWNIFTNVNAYHLSNQADYGNGKTLDLQANALSLYLQNTFTLPKGFTFEISGFYNSPSVHEGSFESIAMWAMEAGIQKKLLDGRANLKLSVSDIFQSQRWGGVSTFGGFYINANGGWESRRMRLNFTYMLGNSKVKSGKRKSGLEEEANRIKG